MGLSGRALSFSHGVFLSFPECCTARRTDRRKKYDLVFIGYMLCEGECWGSEREGQVQCWGCFLTGVDTGRPLPGRAPPVP